MRLNERVGALIPIKSSRRIEFVIFQSVSMYVFSLKWKVGPNLFIPFEELCF